MRETDTHYVDLPLGTLKSESWHPSLKAVRQENSLLLKRGLVFCSVHALSWLDKAHLDDVRLSTLLSLWNANVHLIMHILRHIQNDIWSNIWSNTQIFGYPVAQSSGHLKSIIIVLLETYYSECVLWSSLIFITWELERKSLMPCLRLIEIESAF